MTMAGSMNPETPGNPRKPPETPGNLPRKPPVILQTLDDKDVSFRFVGGLLYAKMSVRGAELRDSFWFGRSRGRKKDGGFRFWEVSGTKKTTVSGVSGDPTDSMRRGLLEEKT